MTARTSKRKCGVSGPTSLRMRSSFACCAPTAGKCGSRKQQRPSSTPAGKCVRIKGLTLDITERKRADEHQRLLVAELDHRVKNVLARVGVVAMYTRQGSSTIDEFVQALDQRIQSMAVAHELLSQNQLAGRSRRGCCPPPAGSLCDKCKYDDLRARHRAHRCGNRGAGDGAARTRNERLQIWRAVDPGGPGVRKLGMPEQRRRGDSA